MKHVLQLLIVFLATILNAYGQNESWINESKTWSTLVYPSSSSEYVHKYTLSSFCKTDTVINSKHYLKIYNSQNEDLSEASFTGLCIRQDGDKIYHYNTNREEELLLMDFSLKEKDRFTCYGEPECWINSVEDITLADGTKRKCLRVVTMSATGSPVDIWVEGIGSLFTGIEVPSQFSSRVDFKLLCCHDNKGMLYQDPYLKTCYKKTYPQLFLTTENVKWREVNKCSGIAETPKEFDLYDYEVLGDTLIQSKIYKKVYLSINEQKANYYSAIRYENGDLLCIPGDEDKEYTMADFNWNEGNKLQFADRNGSPYEFNCNIAGYMNLGDGQSHEYIQLDDSWGNIHALSGDVRFIRYFGSTLGIFSYLMMSGNEIKCHLFNELVWIHIDKDIIYQSPYYTEEGEFITPPDGKWLGKGTKWTEARYRHYWSGLWDSYFYTTDYELKEGGYINGNYYWSVYANGNEITKMREDDKGNIYIKDFLYQEYQESNEFLLYTFGKEPWKVGDKISYATLGIEGITTTESSITNLENFTLKNGKVVPIAENMIYGIGNMGGIIEFLRPQPTNGSQATLYTYYRKGELLFQSDIVGIKPTNVSEELTCKQEGDAIIFHLTSVDEKVSLYIYDTAGRKIGIYPFTNNELKISHLPAGIYLYRLFSSKEVNKNTGRFVISK